MRSAFLIWFVCLFYSASSQSVLTTYFDNNTRLWGYKSEKGGIAIEAKYNIAREFSSGVAFVEKCEDRWGPCTYSFIDDAGNIVLEVPKHLMVYSANQFFSEGLIAAYNKHEGKFGYINLKGETILPFQYDVAFNFSEGKAVVVQCAENEDVNYELEFNLTEDCHMSVISRTMETILEIPDSLFHKWGTTVEPAPLEFREGLLRVTHAKTGKMGFINPEGELVIPCQYDGAGNFREGLAYVCILKNTYMDQPGGNLVGYIDRKDEMKIKLPTHLADLPNGCYFHGLPFANGKAKMIISENDGDCGNWGHIVVNPLGQIIDEKWY